MAQYFVSFYPRIPLDENVSIFEPLDDNNLGLMLRQAAGVLVPPYISPWRYHAITRLANSWFPRLDARFAYQGKIRQIDLFRRLGVRYPETHTFRDPATLVQYLQRFGAPWEYPFVLKGDKGGGGSTVYPIYRPSDISRHIVKLPAAEPLLLQKWVKHGGKDLRVVVYGTQAISYFRVGGGQFYNNVCRGSRIDHDLCPEQRRGGILATLEFCRKAFIDIAGFDLMFPDNHQPVFIEINFHFGRKGLGGRSGHQKKVEQAVKQWRANILKNGCHVADSL